MKFENIYIHASSIASFNKKAGPIIEVIKKIPNLDIFLIIDEIDNCENIFEDLQIKKIYYFDDGELKKELIDSNKSLFITLDFQNFEKYQQLFTAAKILLCIRENLLNPLNQKQLKIIKKIRYDQIVVTDKHIVDFLCNEYAILPNKVSILETYFNDDNLKIQNNFQKKDIVIIEDINEHTNILIVAEIARYYPQYNFKIIGEIIDQNVYKSLITKILKYELVNIEFSNQKIMQNIYENTKLIIALSQNTGIPVELLKVMSVGIPAIINMSDVTAPKITNSESIIIKSVINYDFLVNFYKLIYSESEYERACENAITIANKYNIKNHQQSIKYLFDNIYNDQKHKKRNVCLHIENGAIYDDNALVSKSIINSVFKREDTNLVLLCNSSIYLNKIGIAPNFLNDFDQVYCLNNECDMYNFKNNLIDNEKSLIIASSGITFNLWSSYFKKTKIFISNWNDVSSSIFENEFNTLPYIRYDAVGIMSDKLTNLFARKYNIDKEKIVVVKSYLENIPKIAFENFYEKDIIYVTKVTPEKNIELFLNFAKKYTKYNFKIYGYIEDKKYYKKMLKICEKEKIKNVKFYENFELKKAFKTCKIMIHTSNHEGLPLSILKALSYGIPTFMSNNWTSASEVALNDHYLIKFNSIDLPELDKLLKDEKAYLKAVKLSRQKAKNYLINNNSEYLKKVFLKKIMRENAK